MEPFFNLPHLHNILNTTLTKEDVDKNFKKPLVGTETNSLKACGSMLWSSRKIYKDNDFRLAWDYDPDTSAEPVYEQGK